MIEVVVMNQLLWQNLAPLKETYVEKNSCHAGDNIKNLSIIITKQEHVYTWTTSFRNVS